MADEQTENLDDILGGAPPADTPPADDKVTVTKDELDALRAAADNVDALTGTVRDLESQLQRIQTAPPPQQQQQGGQRRLTGEDLWNDPETAIDNRVQEGITKAVGPTANQFAAQLASMAIRNFRQSKASDPLFSGVAPIFDKRINTLNKVYLGSLQADALDATLAEAWNASVGVYVQEERTKRAKQRPANLSGDSSGGGSPKVLTLEEVDPKAYRMAVAAGLSAEDMAEIARDYQEA